MDKNAEVLACGASIMKDVWEIRLREYRQKRQMEEERIRRSALERINQDWHARMTSKIKTLKRLERKAKLPEEPTLDAQKAKKTHLGRPQGFQSSRIQKQADTAKTTKASKLALLRHLNESCPGLMVWAKSWKFSQPLPKPEENPCVVNWGQSWKFLNLQPNTENKPWCDLGFDANNNISTNDVFLWEKLSKSLNSEWIQPDLVTAEWEKSWKFTQKARKPNEDTSNCANEIEEKCNELWGDSAPEWQESWKSTKHVKEAEIRMDIQPSANEEKQSECPWDNSWMYFKKQLHISDNSAWKESWRLAKTTSRPESKSVQFQAAVPEEMHHDICNMIMNMSREMTHTILFGERDPQPSEWEKSWKTIKNQSEYKEEINKAEVEVKVETQKPDNSKQQAERVKFDILALPKIQKKQEMLHSPKEIDWNDSWKMLKRHCGEERGFWNPRRPLQQLPTQTLNEWTDSWRFTNLTLNQDAGLWEQEWSTNTQPRPIRRVQENEDFPHNGPAGVRVWSESWRSTRRQHLAERQGASASTQPICRHAYARSVADWDQSWKSSTHKHHDRPSMTDWADSWRFSNSEDLQPEYSWFEKSMEIKGRICRASNAFRRHMDSQDWNDSWRVKKTVDGLAHLMKNEVLDWDNSWMFSSTGFYQRQGEVYSNFQTDVRSNAMLKSVQMECSSEWGRSWKMSNPQPPKNIASWVDAKSFNAQNNALMLWSKHKHINYLPSALVNDLQLNIWSKSWRFVKMDANSNLRGESVKTTKSPTVMCLNIDQQKPQEKRWSDACQIAKMQTKRSKSSHNEDEHEHEMFAEWTESWKLSNNLKSHDPAMVSVSLGNWRNSWKFLLESYAPVNGPKTSKSR